MSADITAYTGLVTSQHADKPKYMACIAALVQPLADASAALGSLPALFDLDRASGVQLDVAGQWAGVGRIISLPITSGFFALDTDGLGFDEGIWDGPYNVSQNALQLDDSAYRTLLKARIMANHWDGTIPGAYAVYDAMFVRDLAVESGALLLTEEGDGIIITNQVVAIQDSSNMSMNVLILGVVPTDPVTVALMTGPYLGLKPAGVGIDGYLKPSVADAPFFGFDCENSVISGFDAGSWGVDIL